MNAVALARGDMGGAAKPRRTSPAPQPAPADATPSAPNTDAADTRSPMERLLDKFR